MTPSPAPDLDRWPVADYAPYGGGRYTTGAGFFPLKRDSGNGKLDAMRFQIDRNYRAYLANKQAARSENWNKYSVIAAPDPAALRSVALDTLAHMTREYPQLFTLHEERESRWLRNELTGERIGFSPEGDLAEFVAADKAPLPAHSLFDALFAQLPEDAALIELDPTGAHGDRVTALHLTAPNYWSAAEKIGRNFAAIHAPVPGMDEVLRRYPPLLAGVIRQGPFVRFAWGLGTDARLNHHPTPPPDFAPQAWHGRRFDPDRPELYVRYERQILSGFAAPTACVLFTIRTYFSDVSALSPERLQALAAALLTMTPATLAYKGLAENRDAIRAYIDRLLARTPQRTAEGERGAAT